MNLFQETKEISDINPNKENNSNHIYNCDNEIILKGLPDKSVDMILEDMPYNTTNLKFEYKIDLEAYWVERLRVIKDNGAIVLTGQQPFVTDLINSNRKQFRYEIVWEKTIKMNYMNAGKMPLKGHENVLLFYKKLPTYNPQKYFIGRQSWAKIKAPHMYAGYGEYNNRHGYEDTGFRFPHSVIKISNHNGGGLKNRTKTIHPTQKPVELFAWLIRTYTNPGDIVFDGFSGSGTTAIACLQEGRNYICCEWDEDYYKKSLERIITFEKKEIPIQKLQSQLKLQF